MGYPDTGMLKTGMLIGANPIKEVRRFFDEKHHGKVDNFVQTELSLEIPATIFLLTPSSYRPQTHFNLFRVLQTRRATGQGLCLVAEGSDLVY